MSEQRTDHEQRDERGRLFSVVAEGRRFYYLDTLLDEVERLRAENERMAGTLSDVFCEITGGRLSYPTYDARTIITEVNDRIDEYVREGIAEPATKLAAIEALIEQARKVSPSGSMTVYVGDLEVALGRRPDSVRGIVGQNDVAAADAPQPEREMQGGVRLDDFCGTRAGEFRGWARPSPAVLPEKEHQA